MLKKTFLTFVFLTLLTTFYGLNANFGPYGNRTAGSFIGSAERTEIAHTISVYDELIRSVSEEEGYDWRLMSAIAYHESRFTPDITSRSGARGLMQIMPAVARQFNVTGDRLLDPETNVRLAAQVLSKIDAGLHFAPGTPDDDRMSIILAAYNGGNGPRQQAPTSTTHAGWRAAMARIPIHGRPWPVIWRSKRCPNTTSSRRYAAAGSPVAARQGPTSATF